MAAKDQAKVDDKKPVAPVKEEPKNPQIAAPKTDDNKNKQTDVVKADPVIKEDKKKQDSAKKPVEKPEDKKKSDVAKPAEDKKPNA